MFKTHMKHDVAVEREKEEEVEREGLLSGETSSKREADDPDDSGDPKGWSRKALVITALSFIGILLCASLLPPFFRTRSGGHGDSGKDASNNLGNDQEAGYLKSNGTHDFRRTVLMVSIDGLRADYLDRGLTPHLLEISRVGLRAKWMRPVFPTLTFPNHWSLLTGLYAESHGIVANNFWDSNKGAIFSYNDPKKSWDSSWWSGEPVSVATGRWIWETADKAGVITANLMWPGPPKTKTAASPSYYIPWKDKVPLKQKLDQITQWIDLPLEERPQLIIAYEPSLDQAGHKAGPASKLVNDTLASVDGFARDLHLAIAARNLTDIIDIIFVSDHGMTDTSHVEFVYLENLIGTDYVDAIEHEDGWPSMGLHFGPDTNTSQVLELLLAAAAKDPGKFSVFTPKSMPTVYHLSNNDRIAPIYIVPEIGYALTTRKEGKAKMLKGTHGYNNTDPSMYAMFVSDGPFSGRARQRKRALIASTSTFLSRFLRRGRDINGWHSTGEMYVMRGFQNVEVYGLVAKLLGIESFAANTNGTSGFWDKYL